MKLVLLLLLPARGGLKAKCAEGGREGKSVCGCGCGWGRAGVAGEGGEAEGGNPVGAELDIGGASAKC